MAGNQGGLTNDVTCLSRGTFENVPLSYSCLDELVLYRSPLSATALQAILPTSPLDGEYIPSLLRQFLDCTPQFRPTITKLQGLTCSSMILASSLEPSVVQELNFKMSNKKKEVHSFP